MLECQIEITNKKGLHARAAAKLINLTHNYDSEVVVIRGDDEVNGKSILGLLMLAAQKGSWLTIKVEGTDEDAAMGSIQNLIESKFEEME